MAGIIVFESGDWYSSGSGFCAMSEGIISLLPDTCPATVVKSELRSAVDSQLYFVDATKRFDDEMKRVFLQALHEHIDRTRNMDPNSFPAPDLYEGHLNRLVELSDLLTADLAKKAS